MGVTSTYASRSQVLKAQECPRKRYFEYEIPTSNPNLGGIKPIRLDMNLHVGSCYHVGMENLNRGKSVDEAVGLAMEEYWPPVKAAGFILEEHEDASYVAYEQGALVEALIRGYAYAVLPGNLDRFDIVEVEAEDVAVFEEDGFTLNFGARLDSLLVEKSSQDIYAQSFKTTKEWDKRSDSSARHDMQGRSEAAVLNQRLQRWHAEVEAWDAAGRPDIVLSVPAWFVRRYDNGNAPYVFGVKMEYALKGRRGESPKGSGRYVFSNPLIRPWKKADDLRTFGGKAGNYAFKYEFKDELGGNHRLGKGWNSVNIWEDMGVKNWIDLLATESLQGFAPGYALTQQFVTPIEYYPNDEDIDEWKGETIAQEKHLNEGRRLLKTYDPGTVEWTKIMRAYFPRHTRSCDWPTKCQFEPICFGPKPYLLAPESSGLYTIRSANHKSEEEYNIKEKHNA
jgi:PD-(D/E)XK nuclease superfamily